jgi:hypothetical protein
MSSEFTNAVIAKKQPNSHKYLWYYAFNTAEIYKIIKTCIYVEIFNTRKHSTMESVSLILYTSGLNINLWQRSETGLYVLTIEQKVIQSASRKC